MTRLATTTSVLGLIAAFGIAGPAAAQKSSVEVGVLNCEVSGGAGFLIGSSKRLECSFKRSKGRREHYFGRVNKYGLDIGATSKGVMTWAVFAPTQDHAGPGALAGKYGGVSGEATIGVGVSANALVGGSHNTIVLQPLSIGAQQGLNFALGVTSLSLESGR